MKSLYLKCMHLNLHYRNTKTSLPGYFFSFSYIYTYSQAQAFQNVRLQAESGGVDSLVFGSPKVKPCADALVTIKEISDSKVSEVSMDVISSAHSKAFHWLVNNSNGYAYVKLKRNTNFEVAYASAGVS